MNLNYLNIRPNWSKAGISHISLYKGLLYCSAILQRYTILIEIYLTMKWKAHINDKRREKQKQVFVNIVFGTVVDEEFSSKFQLGG